MKLSDLRKLVQEIDNVYDDHEIVIVADGTDATKRRVGATTTEGVSSIGIGFDWNGGKILVQPEKSLVRLQDIP